MNSKVKARLTKLGQQRAIEMANEARKKLSEKYFDLINWYYADYMPKLDEYGVPYYIRTLNLYESYRPYRKNSHGSVYYGGVRITPSYMHDYENARNNNKFPAGALLSTYIYNPKGTWHGGNWYGGYGEPASFSIYKEIRKYKQELLKEYKEKFENKR